MKNTTEVQSKILNKILQNELNLTASTTVPPILEKTRNTGFCDFDTSGVVNRRHPVFRPYYTDTHLRPIMTSDGHSSFSGSRTSIPRQKESRIKNGEITRSDSKKKKTGFGLPVSVLAKLLRVPKEPKSVNSSSGSFHTETSQNPLSDLDDKLGNKGNTVKWKNDGNIGNGISFQTGSLDW